MEGQIFSLDPNGRILNFWNEEEYKNHTLTQHEHTYMQCCSRHLFPEDMDITHTCQHMSMPLDTYVSEYLAGIIGNKKRAVQFLFRDLFCLVDENPDNIDRASAFLFDAEPGKPFWESLLTQVLMSQQELGWKLHASTCLLIVHYGMRELGGNAEENVLDFSLWVIGEIFLRNAMYIEKRPKKSL